MTGKVPTPGMPHREAQQNRPRGDGKADGLIPKDERGAGGGGPFEPKDADGDFHGGQSGAAYHGHGQLGDRQIDGDDNANAPSRGD